MKETEAGPHLRDLVLDARRILVQHRFEIAGWPLQIYACALMFSPNSSPIRRLFQQDLPLWLTTIHDAEPEAISCLHTLERHTDTVISVVFSYDSTLLLSTSLTEILIWKTTTGACLQTLVSARYIHASTFSHDARKVIAILDDFSIHIWNLPSGSTLVVLPSPIPNCKCEYEPVLSLSYDSRLLAATSGSNLALWDMFANDCMYVIVEHKAQIVSIAFSDDSKLLFSAAKDGKIRIWGVDTGTCCRIVQGVDGLESGAFSMGALQYIGSSPAGLFKIDIHHESYEKVSNNTTSLLQLSPDSTLYAALSRRGDEISIWDAVTGAHIRDVDCQRSWAHSFAFCHDSLLLAAGTNVGEVKLWDLHSRGPSQAALEEALTRIETVSLSANHPRLVLRNGVSPQRIWNITPESHIDFTGRWERLVYVEFPQLGQVPHPPGWSSGLTRLLKLDHTQRDQQENLKVRQNQDRLVTITEDGAVTIWVAKSILLRRRGWLGSSSEIPHVTIRDAGTGRDVGEGSSQDFLGHPSTGRQRGTAVDIVASRPKVWNGELANVNEQLTIGWSGGGIGYNSELLLWLPSNYRVTFSGNDVLGDVVAIVDASRRLWIYRFDLKHIQAWPQNHRRRDPRARVL